MTFRTAGVNAMCSNVVLGVMVLAAYGFLPVSSNEECTSSASTIRVQNSCKQEDEDLMQAHSSNDILDICRMMAAMFKCTVTSLPYCYDYFERTTFSMYFHSPFSCELSPQQIIELQNIHNRGAEISVVDVSATTPAAETSISTTSDTRYDEQTKSKSPKDDDGQVTSTKQDDEETTLITPKDGVTNTKQGDDLAVTTASVTSYAIHKHVTMSGQDQWVIVATENEARGGSNEEQRGALSDNGTSLVVFSKFPIVLLMLWSSTLSSLLTS